MDVLKLLEEYEFYLALGLMVTAAVTLVYLGSRRGLKSFEGAAKAPETLSTGDAAQFPLSGSMALFTMYVMVKYIPSAYIGIILGFYLSLFAVFALNYFVRPYFGANVVVGLASIAVGVLYFYTDKHWAITNVFGVSISVVAIQSMVVGSFPTGAVLLCGLFFYDIFWVFGTDVMVSVATNIDGPIKILCPQNPITWRSSNMSLLGLGDIVVPGFYIALLCVFSTVGRDHMRRADAAAAAAEKKGKVAKVIKPASNVYFIVAMVAYALSLVNTMVVMVVFKHAQPALLYIVPWLLVTTVLTAAVKGELSLLWRFDVSMLFQQETEALSPEEAARIAVEEEAKRVEAAKQEEEDSIMWVIKDFFGLHPKEEPAKIADKESKKKR